MRLYRKIYFTVLAALLLVVLLTSIAWRLGAPPTGEGIEMVGEVAVGMLPPAGAPAAQQKAALVRAEQRLHIDLVLLDADGKVIASAGNPLPPDVRFPADRPRPGFMRGPGGPGWVVPLPDGRTLVAHLPPRRQHPALALILFLSFVALVVAICAYPVVRGLTLRIERLQRGVETLGRGDLSARVPVEGRDEVAKLAQSFNEAAAHIEDLVGAHRLLLANASHELRTPLSRLRMGIELVGDGIDPTRRAALAQDMAELDDLVGEILLSSRLEAMRGVEHRELTDMLGLAAEEGARIQNCDVTGVSGLVDGDPYLLRRLVRNLLENAVKHGRPPVLVHVDSVGAGAAARVRLTVADHGDGVPQAQREDVFTPFWRKPGAAEGTGWGLGLSLVRQIARRHGGDVQVVDDRRGGSAFEVLLPLARDRSGFAAAPAAAAQAGQTAPGMAAKAAPFSQ